MTLSCGKLSDYWMCTPVPMRRWIVVSNEVGMGVVPATRLGVLYRDMLGRANQRMAEAADEVVLLVAGIAVAVAVRREDLSLQQVDNQSRKRNLRADKPLHQLGFNLVHIRSQIRFQVGQIFFRRVTLASLFQSRETALKVQCASVSAIAMSQPCSGHPLRDATVFVKDSATLRCGSPCRVCAGTLPLHLHQTNPAR